VKILLVRLDGIGDALACTPLIAALKDAGHELGIALTTRNAAIFAHGAFSWKHVLERREWPAHGHAPADVERTVTQAGRIGYDLALVASEEPDAYRLGRRCAKRTTGFVNGWEKPLKTLRLRRTLDRAMVRPASLARVREHEVETLFSLGAGLHREQAPTREIARLRPLVIEESASATSEIKTIAVQLSPKWSVLGIEPPTLARIVRGLRSVARVRLLASGREGALARAVGELLQGDSDAIDATIFEGEKGMQAWKRAIADAGVLIAPDSGAAHVAGMTGIPCVDVFSDGRYVRIQMQRWKPWASPSALLVGDRDAPLVAAARDLFEAQCARC
jgi:ADP-heptose:LPS heptosyltransferase